MRLEVLVGVRAKWCAVWFVRKERWDIDSNAFEDNNNDLVLLVLMSAT